MNKYVLDELTLNALLKYLGSRPYVETFHLVDAIKTAELIEESGEVMVDEVAEG